MSICLKNIVYCKSCGRTIGDKYFKFKKMIKIKNNHDNRDVLKKLNITCSACKIVVTTTIYNTLLINL